LGEPSPPSALANVNAAAAAAEAATTDVVVKENSAKENGGGGGSGSPPRAPLCVTTVTSRDGFSNGFSDGFSDGVSGIPFSAIVHAVQTLSSPPFLRRGDGGVSAGIAGNQGGGDGGIPPRLQLAAVSVLWVLLSGQGADFVIRATAAAVAAAGGAGAVERRDNEEEEGISEIDAGKS